MQDTIDQAKAAFLRAKEGLAHSLATTPDDRINWSPSPTSRSPIQQVAHAASAVKMMHETMDGRTFQSDGTAQADKGFRDWERQFGTREEVLGLLDRNGADYLAWLDTLTPERLASMVALPFSLGSAPMTAMLVFVPDHVRWHTAQVDYIQTIYGDQDWHL